MRDNSYRGIVQSSICLKFHAMKAAQNQFAKKTWLRTTILGITIALAVAAQPLEEQGKPVPAPPGDIPMTIKVTSSAFEPGAPIPKKYTEDGQDVSPMIKWVEAPAEAKELALICDDPDAPTPEPWVHWLIYKIPFTVTNLPEGISKVEKPPEVPGAMQGKNTWPKTGYNGPAPPKGHGVHHYHFKVYALDATLNVGPGLTKTELLAAMKGHIIGEGELVGTYQR